MRQRENAHVPNVTLAECHGDVWLVGGEDNLDDLLLNTLPPTVSLAIVPCASLADVRALWAQRSEAAEEGAEPWSIHPGIVRRIRGLAECWISFTEWSARLDANALAAVRRAADGLTAAPGARVTLRQFSTADAPAELADLQRLRARLVVGALGQAGVAASRVGYETRTAVTAVDHDRLDLVIDDRTPGP
jgi:hypothetical protein